MELSRRVLQANESQTLAIAARAKTMKSQGLDVISLSTGEPDFPTPQCAKDAAIQAIAENFTHYAETNGIPELRMAIAGKFRHDNSIDATPEQILVSTGAKQSIFNALAAMCNEGDEVVIIAPYWVSYPAMAQLCGARPVIIHTDPANRFKVQPEQLARALTAKTKCVIMNSPSNPTGVMYTPEEIRSLASVLSGHTCFIISDEIYEKIVYGNIKHYSIGALPELANRVLTVNGVSKAFAMTGWRIGYMHGPLEVIRQANKEQGQSTSHPDTIAQRAALGALLHAAEDVESMRKEFEKRCALICMLLDALPSIRYIRPDGAFYIFADVSSLLNNTFPTASSLCEYILDKYLLALVPGEAFGVEGYVRFSFAASEAVIRKGMERFAAAVMSL